MIMYQLLKKISILNTFRDTAHTKILTFAKHFCILKSNKERKKILLQLIEYKKIEGVTISMIYLGNYKQVTAILKL